MDRSDLRAEIARGKRPCVETTEVKTEPGILAFPFASSPFATATPAVVQPDFHGQTTINIQTPLPTALQLPLRPPSVSGSQIGYPPPLPFPIHGPVSNPIAVPPPGFPGTNPTDSLPHPPVSFYRFVTVNLRRECVVDLPTGFFELEPEAPTASAIWQVAGAEPWNVSIDQMSTTGTFYFTLGVESFFHTFGVRVGGMLVFTYAGAGVYRVIVFDPSQMDGYNSRLREGVVPYPLNGGQTAPAPPSPAPAGPSVPDPSSSDPQFANLIRALQQQSEQFVQYAATNFNINLDNFGLLRQRQNAARTPIQARIPQAYGRGSRHLVLTFREAPFFMYYETQPWILRARARPKLVVVKIYRRSQRVVFALGWAQFVSENGLLPGEEIMLQPVVEAGNSRIDVLTLRH